MQEINNNKLTKEDQNHHGIVEPPNSLPTEIRFGAPNGPRQQRNEKYDGHKPLEYPGHEAVAQYLATAKSLREFKSDSDLAKHFHVTRMTIHRAKRDIDVIKRAHWLSMHNKLAGDLVARREYPSIMEKAVDLARAGNIKAMEFCAKRAWPEDKELEQSLTFAELIALDLRNPIPMPSWREEEIEEQESVEREAPEGSPLLEEPKAKPD